MEGVPAFIPIIVLGVAALAVRLAGFLLAGASLPPAWVRALGFVPPAVFAALALATLAGPVGDAPARLGAAVAAGLMAARLRQIWAAVAAGLLVAWALRLLP